MAYKLITESKLTNLANAVRNVSSKTGSKTLDELVTIIGTLSRVTQRGYAITAGYSYRTFPQIGTSSSFNYAELKVPAGYKCSAVIFYGPSFSGRVRFPTASYVLNRNLDHSSGESIDDVKKFTTYLGSDLYVHAGITVYVPAIAGSDVEIILELIPE